MDNIKYSVHPGNYPKDNSFDGKAFGALASGLTGSAVGLGLNAIASNITQANQLDMLHESNRLQRENMRFANDLTRRNALDTPKLNRLGMEGAGFNVNAEKGFSPIAGQSGLGSSGSGAQMSPVDLASFTSAMANAKLAQSQAKNLDVDTEGKKIDNDNKQKNYDLTFDNIQANTDKLLADAKNTDTMTDYQVLVNSRYNEIADAELKYTVAKTADANWSAKEREEHIEVFKKQIEEMASHIRNMDADTSLTGAKRKELLARAFAQTTQGRLNAINERLSSAEYNVFYTRVETELAKDRAFTALTDNQKEAVAVQIALGALDLDWYTFDKVCQGIGVATNTASAIWKIRAGLK